MVSSSRTLSRQPTVDADSVQVVTEEYTKRSVQAASYRDGTLLYCLAREHVEAFAKMMPPRHLHLQRHLTWGSACTGSAGDVWVSRAIAHAWSLTNARSDSLQIRHLFGCECHRGKQYWIQKVHAAVQASPNATVPKAPTVEETARDPTSNPAAGLVDDKPCLFDDIKKSAVRRACVLHTRGCAESQLWTFSYAALHART